MHMEIAKIVGNNIKEARKSVRLTQKDVAEKLFMTQQQYSRFENGIYELNYIQLLALSIMFKVSIEDFFVLNEKEVEDINKVFHLK